MMGKKYYSQLRKEVEFSQVMLNEAVSAVVAVTAVSANTSVASPNPRSDLSRDLDSVA